MRLDPKRFLLITNRGNVYAAKKDTTRPSPITPKPSNSTPEPILSAFSNLVLHNKKEYDKAIADYTQVIRLDPKYVFAYRERGIASKKERDGKAIADFNEAIRLDPKYAFAYYDRGSISA